MLKNYAYKAYVSNTCKSQIAYVENNLYKKQDSITFNNADNIYKHVNQYSTDVLNSYKINKTHNVKKTYFNSNNDVFINKPNTINTNGTYGVTKNNSLYDVTGNNYYSKKNFNTSNITNNIARHNHNTYEHHVIKHVHEHIKNINNYGIGINFHNKKSLNKKQYYNFYHGNSNLRKIENIPLTQQTDITKSIAETSNQTITYVDNHYFNNDKIATIDVNPTPSLTDNCIWILETTDNVVPGLESLLTYIQSKYATLTSLQNSITNINNTINTEIQTLQTQIINIEILNPSTQNVSNDLQYHTSHADFMFKEYH